MTKNLLPNQFRKHKREINKNKSIPNGPIGIRTRATSRANRCATEMVCAIQTLVKELALNFMTLIGFISNNSNAIETPHQP